MFTLSFNNTEKQKLLEILGKDLSLEAKEFVRRINDCQGFYGVDEDLGFSFTDKKEIFTLKDAWELEKKYNFNIGK